MQKVHAYNPPDPCDEYVYIKRRPDGRILDSITICIPHDLELAFAYQILGTMWEGSVQDARAFAQKLVRHDYHLDRRRSRRNVTLKPAIPIGSHQPHRK